MERFEVQRAVDLCAQHAVTWFFAVPPVILALANAPVDLGKLHTVKYLLCGAAPLPLEPARQLQDRTDIHVIQGYGMTEALNQVSVRRNDLPRRFNAFLTTS